MPFLDINIILAFLWGHLIADFLLQPDIVQRAKSHSNLFLGIHLVTYLSILLAIGWGVIVFGHYPPPTIQGLLIFLSVNVLSHGLIDRATSREMQASRRKHARWDELLVLSLDQGAHLTILLLTLPMLVG